MRGFLICTQLILSVLSTCGIVFLRYRLNRNVIRLNFCLCLWLVHRLSHRQRFKRIFLWQN